MCELMRRDVEKCEINEINEINGMKNSKEI
jgi:hypothetical protein